MKLLWIKSLLILAVLTAYSHAIFGIGAQYAPNFTAEIEASQDTVLYQNTTNSNIMLNQKSETGLIGFGGKFWIDFLPFIDIEASTNIQFKEYGAALEADLDGNGTIDTTIELEVEAPIVGKRTPPFVKVSSDLSIKYPFLKFPPAISILKLYVGAGITHVMSTVMLDTEFATKAVTGAGVTDPTDTQAISNAIVDAFKDEGLQSGIGGHALVGAKAKLPVIPIAVFVDGKIHFGGGLPDAVSNGLTLEMGAALAF
ncbi:hypothetical protein ACFL5V_00570 [Fibrobacterota bacterium]